MRELPFLNVIMCDYMGGYDDIKAKKSILFIQEDSIVFGKPKKPIFTIDKTDIKSLALEAPDEAEKRITATRVVAFGVLALAMKKNKKGCYIIVTLKDGREVIFELKGTDVMKMRASMSKAIALYND